MNSFLDPVGARPHSVYWRRRAFLAAVLAVLVLMLAKTCSSAAPNLGTKSSNQGPVPLTSTYTPTPKATDKILEGGTDAVPGVHGGSTSGIGSGSASGSASGGATGPGPIGSGAAAGGASKPLATVKPATPGASPGATPGATPKATKVATPTATPKPTPKKAVPVAFTTCKKSAIEVKLRADERTYSGKETPKLFIAVKNVGKVACLADLGSGALTLTVKSGKDRIWSSDDCQGKGTSDIRLLKPGQALEARSVWSKVRSEKGCPKGMDEAQPGTYVVEGSAGGVKAERRAVFQIS